MKNTRASELKTVNVARRASKGTITKVISGAPLVNFLVYNNLVPGGITFEDPELAYSARRSRAIVLPVYYEKEMLELASKAGLASISGNRENDNKQPSSTQDLTVGISDIGGLSRLENRLRREETLLNFLKQNIVMVFINSATLPKNLPAMLKTAADVLIESTDLTQAVIGQVVMRNTVNENDLKQWPR